MTSDIVGDTNAVFTSDSFDRQLHPEGGDSHPPPGRDFAVALGRAFRDAGWDVMEVPADPPEDPCKDSWEHTYWYMHITFDKSSYWVHLEPIGDDLLWRVAFHRRHGCLASLLFAKRIPTISAKLKSDADAIIQRLAKCDDLRWVTDDEAIALW